MVKSKTKGAETPAPNEPLQEDVKEVPLEKGPEGCEVSGGMMALARNMASEEKVIRTKAINRLKDFIIKRTTDENFFEFPEMKKLCKCLFYCMWITDKMISQEKLSKRFSTFTALFGPFKEKMKFVKAFFSVMIQEWTGLDNHRQDKYLFLIRMIFRSSIEALSDAEFEDESISIFVEAFTDQVLVTGPSAVNITVQYHFCDIYFEELALVCSSKITHNRFMRLAFPFLNYLCWGDDLSLCRHIINDVFLELAGLSRHSLRKSLSENVRKIEVDRKLFLHHVKKLTMQKDITETNRSQLMRLKKVFQRQTSQLPDLERKAVVERQKKIAKIRKRKMTDEIEVEKEVEEKEKVKRKRLEEQKLVDGHQNSTETHDASSEVEKASFVENEEVKQTMKQSKRTGVSAENVTCPENFEQTCKSDQNVDDESRKVITAVIAASTTTNQTEKSMKRKTKMLDAADVTSPKEIIVEEGIKTLEDTEKENTNTEQTSGMSKKKRGCLSQRQNLEKDQNVNDENQKFINAVIASATTNQSEKSKKRKTKMTDEAVISSSKGVSVGGDTKTLENTEKEKPKKKKKVVEKEILIQVDKNNDKASSNNKADQTQKDKIEKKKKVKSGKAPEIDDKPEQTEVPNPQEMAESILKGTFDMESISAFQVKELLQQQPIKIKQSKFAKERRKAQKEKEIQIAEKKKRRRMKKLGLIVKSEPPVKKIEESVAEAPEEENVTSNILPEPEALDFVPTNVSAKLIRELEFEKNFRVNQNFVPFEKSVPQKQDNFLTTEEVENLPSFARKIVESGVKNKKYVVKPSSNELEVPGTVSFMNGHDDESKNEDKESKPKTKKRVSFALDKNC